MTIQNAPSENSDQTANAQADLNLRWANMSAGMISAVVAHMVLKFYGPGNNVSVVSDQSCYIGIHVYSFAFRDLPCIFKAAYLP